MQFIQSSGKPYFLINMNPESSLKKFKEASANLIFNLDNVVWKRWEVGKPLEEKLVAKIYEKLLATPIAPAIASVTAPAPTPNQTALDAQHAEGGDYCEAAALAKALQDSKDSVEEHKRKEAKFASASAADSAAIAHAIKKDAEIVAMQQQIREMKLLQQAKEAQEKAEREAIFRQERRRSQAKEAKKAADKILADKARADAQKKAAAKAEVKAKKTAESKLVADKIFADKTRADAQREAAVEAKKHGRTMLVTVPAGSTSGTRVRVQTPAGLVEVTIPAGVNPGQSFEIQYELPTSGGGVCEPAAAPQPPAFSSTSQLQHRTMLVTVPPGSTPGTRVRVQTPAGLVEVKVPAGVAPGQSFEIQYVLPSAHKHCL
jgi:hypothetical protein